MHLFGKSFGEKRRTEPPPRTCEIPQKLIIAPLSLDETILVEPMMDILTNQFHTHTEIQEFYIDLSEFFNADRVQYDANAILNELQSHTSDGKKIMGVVGVDLYVPVLTYIFGQALLGGDSGIVSTHRLRNEFYGMERDEDLYSTRLMKIILHEVGHMHGFHHCHDIDCLMKASTYIEDVDQKSPYLCKACVDKLQFK